MSSLPEIPPHRLYYLHNFTRAVQWVRARHADLLQPQEQNFWEAFEGLPQPSQALLVRMLMRRGPWFRPSQLRYDEIGDPMQAAAPLLALGWLDGGQPLGVQALFDLYTRAELQAWLAPEWKARLTKTDRKSAWLQTLQDWQEEPVPHAAWCPQAPEPVWCLMVSAQDARLRLLFFGNLRQSWAEFVLADLGVFRYETVPLDAAAHAFRGCEEVQCYLRWHAAREALAQGLPPADVLAQALTEDTPPPVDNSWLAARRAKLLWRIGQAAERERNWAVAQQAYEASDHPEARHRRIRVLEQQGQFADALALAQKAVAQPACEAEGQRVARMLPRLRRQAGVPQPARAPRLAVPKFTLQLPVPDAPRSVEWLVREHLHRPETPVFYVENTLINSLFGLLCWPAIFAPVPGAFFHPFQRGPADWGAADFAARRASWFDAALAELDSGCYRDTIRQRYRDKQGIQSPLVAWAALTPELLELALACMPAVQLKAIFTRLRADVQANHTGLPDLIRFEPAKGRFEMIEVKGPGDRLQDNQQRWLQHCLHHGVPVRVCHVVWVADDGANGGADGDVAVPISLTADAGLAS